MLCILSPESSIVMIISTSSLFSPGEAAKNVSIIRAPPGKRQKQIEIEKMFLELISALVSLLNPQSFP